MKFIRKTSSSRKSQESYKVTIIKWIVNQIIGWTGKSKWIWNTLN